MPLKYTEQADQDEVSYVVQLCILALHLFSQHISGIATPKSPLYISGSRSSEAIGIAVSPPHTMPVVQE